MTATYTWDVFSSLDGFGAADRDGTGYRGKQGPGLLDRRLALYNEEQRIVFGEAARFTRTRIFGAPRELAWRALTNFCRHLAGESLG